ncbi:hypothetical protein C1H46_037921 [Malus baccata]|uniref:Protein kinase domain-containing protein n=1 Tax=Malus baccata TaxID=106549 RepID=A0A540KQY0_MALBA|nr:hypothetical protein C1H46_037921 [Malus baccata]
MKAEPVVLIVGLSIGVVIGVLLAISGFFCIRYHRRRLQIGNSSSRRAATIPIRANGADSCTILSDSTLGPDSPVRSGQNGKSFWHEGFKKSNVVSMSGIPEYSYKDLQKATYNFTTLIGQGAFGPVYKAQMSTGETVAVKVLATDSTQGEKEFQTEVKLLGRLHHRNLVNLIGYCAEKGQHMLIYVYMSKGSLASHLYSEKHEPLSWDLRVLIALDVARGLEYLHDGAVPPVIHRDIKSSNILLDQSMRARAAMNTEGKLGWEEIVDSRLNGSFHVQELNEMAALAYKCVSRAPKKRPSMRDIVQVLSRMLKMRHNRNHVKSLSSVTDEGTTDVNQPETRIQMTEHHREESVDSLADTYEAKLTVKPCLIVVKLKRWERKECKPNSLPVLHKMHVKVGDTVKVISGHEKGKTGEVTKIFKHNSTVIVKEINLKTKHMKSREEGEPGQILKVEGAIHSSNVMLFSKEKNVASRVGHKILENGQRVRYLIKTGEIIDSTENWKKLKEEKKKTEEAVTAA